MDFVYRTIGGSGSVAGMLRMTITDPSTFLDLIAPVATTAGTPVTVDTTVDKTITVQGTYDTADSDNLFIATTASMEVLNA
jgi:hypothetical protein